MSKQKAYLQIETCTKCGQKFQAGFRQKMCYSCQKKAKDRQRNRAFTKETPYLVWFWHTKHDDNFELIALVLNRTIDNVKQAYRQYIKEHGLKEVANE